MKQLACCLSLILAVSAVAQHREVQTVEVVQVPVYVTSWDGAVITGLTRDNFELLVNGKRQTIDYFDVIDFGAVATPADGPARDVRQRRLYVLLFDLLYSTPNSVYRAQRAAEKLIANRGAADEFSIAAMTPQHGLEIIVPFTRDLPTLTRAVRSLRVSAVADSLRLGVSADEVSALQVTDRGGDSNDSCPPQSACADLQRDYSRNFVKSQTANLSGLAQQLAPLEGQKHVVLLSNGFDPSIAHGATGRPAPVDPQVMTATPITAKMTLKSAPPLLDAHILGGIKGMHAAFNAAGVVLDAIDTRGLRPGGNFEDDEALVMMARETGGDVVEHRNDLAEALQVLTDRQRVVYVLGFHVRNARKQGNTIEVNLRNVEGHTDLRYRRSFSTTSAAPASVLDGIRLADILTNDIPQNGIDVQLAASGGTLEVTVPVSMLLAQIDKRAELHAFLYVFDGTRAIASKEKDITIDRAQLTKANRPAIGFRHHFDLPAGEYTAKVVIALGAGESLGFARTSFRAVP